MNIKKNKNGFMFIETIVTLTILMTVLLLLYSTFTNLLGNEKRVTDYEKKGYRYSLFYIKEWMIDNGWNLENNNIFNGKGNFHVITNIPLKIKNIYNLKSLVIMKCKSSGHDVIDKTVLGNEIDADGTSLSYEFKEYLKNLGTCKEYNRNYATYRIIGEFYDQENKQDYQAFIYYPNLEVGY